MQSDPHLGLLAIALRDGVARQMRQDDAAERYGHVCQSGGLRSRHRSRACQTHRHGGRKLQCPPDVVEFGCISTCFMAAKICLALGSYRCRRRRRLFRFQRRLRQSLTYGGVGLQLGDVVFHSCGERVHQRTDGEGQWGLISLPPEQLAACSMALTGKKIVSPPGRPSTATVVQRRKRLLRLHSKVCRLAETRHELIANPEVARSLEQELLHALLNCLTADDARGNLEKESGIMPISWSGSRMHWLAYAIRI